MLGLSDLTRMAGAIKKARNEESHPGAFGSLNVLLVGDQYQFPPVTNVAVYRQNCSNLKDQSRQGHHIWRQFTTVVFLEEQMRSPDPMWFPFLQRLRHAYTWDPEMGDLDCHQRDEMISKDHAMLHSIILGTAHRPVAEWRNATLITPRNSVCIAAAEQLLKHRACAKKARGEQNQKNPVGRGAWWSR